MAEKVRLLVPHQLRFLGQSVSGKLQIQLEKVEAMVLGFGSKGIFRGWREAV